MPESKEEWMAILEQLLRNVPDGLDMTAMELLSEKVKAKVGEATITKVLERLGP